MMLTCMILNEYLGVGEQTPSGSFVTNLVPVSKILVSKTGSPEIGPPFIKWVPWDRGKEANNSSYTCLLGAAGGGGGGGKGRKELIRYPVPWGSRPANPSVGARLGSSGQAIASAADVEGLTWENCC